MFRSVNFELDIDYHRRVKEYQKLEAEKAARIRKVVIVTVTIAALVTVYTFRKRFGW